MLINPKEAIKNGWITGIVDEEKQVQPNAIDFTLDHLYEISDNQFVISEAGKVMRGGREMNPVLDRASGDIEFWTMKGRTVYDGLSNITVDLPEGVACELIIRSTFNRNGIFLTSGLYDSGYQGKIGFALHNQSASLAKIGIGTRVGQIKFIASDSAGMYAGGYNNELGYQHIIAAGGQLQGEDDVDGK